ncbi:MAG: hypothetical protein KGL39_40185 [Patescibacteria group bacterium]|nr:hypothetical protein [Patescibacteria group bacterium]
MRCLIACEFSGIVRDAFAALGWDAWSCDLLPTERPGNHIQADFRSVVEDSWDFVGYHYECRVMANSGVRWLETIPGRRDELAKAAEMFNLTLRDTRPGYSENSIMHCHAKALIDREQDQTIQPWWFGEPFFKGTCLWLRGLPKLTPSDKLTPPERGTDEHKKWSEVHRMAKTPDRWKNRSRTKPRIAAAMADQWTDFLTKNNNP